MDDIKHQIWFCPKCRAIGCYVYKKEDASDIFGIVDGIRAMHKNASCGCSSDVRLIAIDNINRSIIFTYAVS